MAKQTLAIGSSANDGTGDSLRDGAIKLNSVINELYTNLGNDTNLQINVGSPTQGQLLKWNGAQFAEGGFNSFTEDIDVNDFSIISSANGDITLKPNGTGDIKFWAANTGSALTYIDGEDGKLKYSNHFPTSGDLPDVATHHGMFAYVSGDGKPRVASSTAWIPIITEQSGLGSLGDVDMTVGGGPSGGQVIKWNGSTNKWEPANDDSSGGGGGGTTQNLFEGFTADTGSTTATAATDVLTVAGGTNISTTIVGDTLTIDMTGALGDANQNAYGGIGSDGGSKTASSATATINVIGGTGISTAISGDNLTVTNDSPNVSQNIFQTIAGDGGTTAAGSATTTLTVAGGNGVTTAATADTLTVNADLYLTESAVANDNIVFNGTAWEPVESPTVSFTVTAPTMSDYQFSGGGMNTSSNNPTIYVHRGFTYRFNNSSGVAHPFELRQSAGGSAVTVGVTGSTTGVQYYTVPMALASGTNYKYQCTLHPAMVGDIIVV
jgi:plastocyanin